MAEYSGQGARTRFMGADPGYVGFGRVSTIYSQVMMRPYSVVAFDEIEKAHGDFADILLQILDDGRLTDNKGRTVSFKNAVILLTTNSKNPEDDFTSYVAGAPKCRRISLTHRHQNL